MGAVLVVVHRVGVVVGEVDAVTVIDEAVAVVVDTVVVAVRRVPVHVRGEVLVVVVDPRVDHTDDDVAAACRDAPRLGPVDVRIGAVIKAPERAKLGIVRDSEGMDDVVGFRIQNCGNLPVAPDRFFHLQPLRQLDEFETLEGLEPLHDSCPARGMGRCPGRGRDPGRESHEELVGDVLGDQARPGRLTRGVFHAGSEEHDERANEGDANGSNSSGPVHFRSARLVTSELFEAHRETITFFRVFRVGCS